MSLNFLGLGFVFEAQDHASHVIHELEGRVEGLEKSTGVSLDKMDDAFEKLGVGIAGALIGFEGLEKSFELAEAASKGEMALAELKATTGATADEMHELEQAAIDASKGTKFDDDTALKNLRLLRQAGFDTAQAIDLLRPSLELAQVSLGELSPEEAAKGLAQTMRAFGIDSKNGTLAVDQMTKAMSMFGLEAGSLPEAMGIAERGAHAMNQSMTEVLLVTGMTKAVFGSSTRAAMTLGREMGGMADPKLIATLKHMGVNVLDNEHGFRKFLDVVADLTPHLDKMTEAGEQAFLKKNFGDNSVIGVLVDQLRKGVKTTTGEVLHGAAAIEYLRDTYRNLDGTAEHLSHQLHDTFEGKTELMEKVGHDLREEIGVPFKDLIRPALDLAEKALEKVLDAVRATPMPLKLFGAGVLLLTFGLIGLAGVALTLSVGLPLLKTGFMLAKLEVAEFAVATWAAVAPLIPFAVAAALVGGIVYAVQNNVAGLGDAWDYWVSVIDVPLVRTLGEALLIAGGAFLLFSNAMAIGEGMEAITTAVWAFNAALFANPLTWIIGGFVALGALIYAISTNWHGLGDDFKAGAMIIGEWLDDMSRKLRPFTDLVGKAWDAVSGLFGSNDQAQHVERQVEDVAGMETDIDKIQRVERGAAGFVAPDESKIATKPDASGFTEKPGGLEDVQSKLGIPAGQLPESVMEQIRALQDGKGGAIDYQKMADAMSKRPVHAVFEIDGEHAGDAIANARRGSLARQGVPTGVE